MKNTRLGGKAVKLETDEPLSSCAVNGGKQQVDVKTESPVVAGKNRRKIRQPKQYKPKTMDDKGHGENNGSHNALPATDEEAMGSHETTNQDAQISPSSSSIVDGESLGLEDTATSQASPVHVMTARHEPKPTSLAGKGSAQKQPKKSGGRGPAKRPKHPNPVVPMKPEDLILAAGGLLPQALKRDAQYRKSYAYKIWKEKASCEVPGESEETKETGGGDGAISAFRRQGPLYWHPNQHNGTGIASGFYANGKYYAVNPPQIIHGDYCGPQVSQSTPPIPQPPFSTTNPSPPVNATGLHQSAESPREASYCDEDPNKGAHQGRALPPVIIPPMSPPIPKTPVTIPSYPSDIDHATLIGENGKSKRASSIDASHEQTNGVSTSPATLVSVMKSTLRKKNCKENVQPFSPKTKQKTKRKLDADDNKNDAGSAKRSAKPTIFTPLDEQQAEKLANDIYDVNLEYFPFQTLAEKAAQSGKDKSTETTQTDKAEEIDKVRCLLKDFYDITYSCTEDPDMKKFDSASRKFGRKNILNHLSLLDRYFSELQKRLDSTR